MERGSRRLLHDLEVLGRLSAYRVSARERLRLEVGPLVMHQLLPAEAEAERRSTGSRGRRRRVA